MPPAITGTAAGVPFTALPPAHGGPAPLIVTWHMLDAPRSDAAFAAALPMDDLPAWRVHLGMPMCGARMVGGSMDAGAELMRKDVLMAFLYPFVRQATEEFPAALAAFRAELPVDDGPIGLLGGSLGGAVALRVLADAGVPVFAAAVVNPAIRLRSVVNLFPDDYPYEADSTRPPTASTSSPRRAPSPAARRCWSSAGSSTTRGCAPTRSPSSTRWATAPSCCRSRAWPHPLADEPGIEPAPQLPTAREVDAGLTRWFRRHLPAGG